VPAPGSEPFTLRPIDEMQTINGGTTRLAGAELGVESFGMQVFDYPPLFEGYPEHDHGEEGQEEVYLVLRGSAEFELGGERVLLVPGLILRVAPETRRRLLPGPEGVRILVLGGMPGEAYERPDAFRLR
jgi:mannose-6-phosphate isomerase-like protein (cupin superfamily)